MAMIYSHRVRIMKLSNKRLTFGNLICQNIPRAASASMSKMAKFTLLPYLPVLRLRVYMTGALGYVGHGLLGLMRQQLGLLRMSPQHLRC